MCIFILDTYVYVHLCHLCFEADVCYIYAMYICMHCASTYLKHMFMYVSVICVLKDICISSNPFFDFIGNIETNMDILSMHHKFFK